MADCINFPCHGDSCRVFENLMQSAILFLALKVAKVGPKTVVQPSPNPRDHPIFLAFLLDLSYFSTIDPRAPVCLLGGSATGDSFDGLLVDS